MIEKKIKFTSTISDETEQLIHDFVAQGSVYFHKNNTVARIDFAEPMDDGLTLETSIIIEPDVLKIIREGAISMAQEFVLGEQVPGVYETDYGTFETQVYTTVLEITGDQSFGEIYLVYDFYLDNEYTSKINLTIEYE